MEALVRDALSPGQLEVLRLVARGSTDAEIGKLRFTAESTAKRHVRDVLSKLGARNRAHAVHIAHGRGLL